MARVDDDGAELNPFERPGHSRAFSITDPAIENALERPGHSKYLHVN